jgi:hypothetical protein
MRDCKGFTKLIRFHLDEQKSFSKQTGTANVKRSTKKAEMVTFLPVFNLFLALKT